MDLTTSARPVARFSIAASPLTGRWCWLKSFDRIIACSAMHAIVARSISHPRSCASCMPPNTARSNGDSADHRRQRHVGPFSHGKTRAKNLFRIGLTGPRQHVRLLTMQAKIRPSEIKRIRGKRSQKEFGRLLGVARETVNLWESGVHVPSRMARIAIKRLNGNKS